MNFVETYINGVNTLDHIEQEPNKAIMLKEYDMHDDLTRAAEEEG